MDVAHRSAPGFLAVVIGLAMLVGVPAPRAQSHPPPPNGKAASPWMPQRLPDGHPDFQGVWANNTVTPLQRPKQWEGKTELTDADIAALQKVAEKIAKNDGDA